jgi:cytochrome P450
VKKGEWYKTLDISAGAPSVQMMIDKHEHAVRRRTLAPAFSERALKDAESLIAVHARKLVEQIGTLSDGSKQGDWTQPKNMSLWATYFGFDFVSDLGYGQSFGMIEKEEYRWIPPVLMSASGFIYYLGYLPFAALVRPLLGTSIQNYVGGQSAADSLRYTHLANKRLAERMEAEDKMRSSGKEATRRDTFHYLLNSKDPVTGKEFTTEELQADSALIIAAGSDGVGLAISATIFYLLHNPTALSKLNDEIRSAFTSVSEIRNPVLSSLPYLSACIDEALRMCPPKPSSVPRQVLSGGITIDGHHIPKGTTVGTPIYVLHHDEVIYPLPWDYCPERWIVDEKTGVTPKMVATARNAFCPFLIGPMNCIGKNMAYIATKVALAHLLYFYDIRPTGKVTGGGGPDLEEGRHRENEYQMTDYVLGFRDGPIIELKART